MYMQRADVYNKDKESESIEESDNEGSTQHQLALNTLTSFPSVPTSAAGSSSLACVLSLLRMLHSPQPAAITRKRKVAVNPPGGK